jgi:succinyl-CoA synthetase beta subunit
MMSVDLAKFNLAMGMLFSKDNMNFLESVSDIYSGEKLQAFNLFFNSMNEYKAIVNSKGGVSSPNLVFKTNDKILKTATENMRISYSRFKGNKVETLYFIIKRHFNNIKFIN